jgi:hypothetical protein
MFHYGVQNSSLLILTMSQLNPVHIHNQWSFQQSPFFRSHRWSLTCYNPVSFKVDFKTVLPLKPTSFYAPSSLRILYVSDTVWIPHPSRATFFILVNSIIFLISSGVHILKLPHWGNFFVQFLLPLSSAQFCFHTLSIFILHAWLNNHFHTNPKHVKLQFCGHIRVKLIATLAAP